MNVGEACLKQVPRYQPEDTEQNHEQPQSAQTGGPLEIRTGCIRNTSPERYRHFINCSAQDEQALSRNFAVGNEVNDIKPQLRLSEFKPSVPLKQVTHCTSSNRLEGRSGSNEYLPHEVYGEGGAGVFPQGRKLRHVPTDVTITLLQRIRVQHLFVMKYNRLHI